MRRIGQILVDLGFITDDQLELLLEEQKRRPGELLGQGGRGAWASSTKSSWPRRWPSRWACRSSTWANSTIPPDVLAKVTEPMAQLYRIVPIEFRRQHADDRHVRSAKARRFRTSCGRSWASTCGRWWPPSATCSRPLERYYAAGSESVESLVSDMEDDEELAGAADGDRPRWADRSDQRRGPGRQRAGPQAAEHGAADGHQGPRQRLALRAVRRRIQDPHQGRRRAVRNGAAAAAPGVCHHHPHQGHGESRHRRAPPAARRPHRADRRRPSGRSARQRAADHVRRKRRHAGARPLGRVARSEQGRHGRRRR